MAGWPGAEFNPSAPLLDVMETGWDILGFWVARMIAMTIRLSGGQVPFSNVILHGLIRDSSGKKMSKSLGNVIDPLDVVYGISRDKMIERIKNSSLSEDDMKCAISSASARYPSGITRCGPDALRFALLRHNVFSSDILLDVVDLSSEGLRFCNKLWNMITYFESINEKFYFAENVDSDHPVDEWILSRLADTLIQIDKHMTDQRPHLAFAVLHNFILRSFCDVYIESTKRAVWDADLIRVAQIRRTFIQVIQPTLVQLSVFMPFIAEHLYERALGREPGSIYFDFVKPSFFKFYRNAQIDFEMDILIEMVAVVRSIRQQLQLPSSMVFTGALHSSENISNKFLRLSPILSDLAKLELSDVTPLAHPVPSGFMTCPIPGHKARLSVKIQESQRAIFISRLERLLHKYEERRQQFLGKADKYEAILCKSRQEGNLKSHVIEKYEKKVCQARGVASGADEEIKRLRSLLEETAS